MSSLPDERREAPGVVLVLEDLQLEGVNDTTVMTFMDKGKKYEAPASFCREKLAQRRAREEKKAPKKRKKTVNTDLIAAAADDVDATPSKEDAIPMKYLFVEDEEGDLERLSPKQKKKQNTKEAEG